MTLSVARAGSTELLPVTLQRLSARRNYFGRPAISVFSLSSSDPMVYRHSAPRLLRIPVTRINRDSDGDSDPSTKTSNSPGTNISRLRVATNIALNASFTRNLVIVTSVFSPKTSSSRVAQRVAFCRGAVRYRTGFRQAV